MSNKLYPAKKACITPKIKSIDQYLNVIQRLLERFPFLKSFIE